MWWPGELRGKKGLFATEHIESFNQDNVSSPLYRRNRVGLHCLVLVPLSYLIPLVYPLMYIPCIASSIKSPSLNLMLL